ncbi:MAG: hypothetical protein KA214_06690 [Neisseriaceae bacterium]|nr:hypothetical protein [Neisseriaceae bacterium]
MSPNHRIHVVGASGSGTSTLGAALAQRLSCPFVDADDHYWRQDTPQPFRVKQAPADRVNGIRAVLTGHSRWVLSGSLYTWGQDFIPEFTLVVFLYLASEVRMARIRARERARYGDRVRERGDMYAHSQAFLAWAADYDDTQEHSRTRYRHEQWLATLSCPVLRLNSAASVDDLLASVQGFLPEGGS